MVERLRAAGARPALIPFGGSSALAARGYVAAAEELLGQVPDVHTVVVALGSGATMAGLVARLGVERVLGVHVGAVDDPRAVVSSFASALGAPAPADGLRIDDEQVGNGYGSLTDPVKEALPLTARREGIILDPTYTGRAMAGLIAAARRGEIRSGQKTVFLHTDGLPGLFGHAEELSWVDSILTTL